MQIGEFFVLLMFFGEPLALKEYTIRDSLSECLSAKRKIERQLRGGKSTTYNGTMRLACKQLTVEHDDNYNITEFIDVKPSDLKPY